jgi:hypothetical protein
MKESDIARVCISLLKYKGCIVTRLNSGQWQNALTGSWIMGCPAGTPDYCVAIPRDGYYLFAYMETKAPGKSLNNDQIAFLRDLKKGIPWVVVDDSRQVDIWLADLWNYHGEHRIIKDVLDTSQKFVPVYTGKRKRKTDKMTASIMHQYDTFIDGAKKAEEISPPPF